MLLIFNLRNHFSCVIQKIFLELLNTFFKTTTVSLIFKLSESCECRTCLLECRESKRTIFHESTRKSSAILFSEKFELLREWIITDLLAFRFRFKLRKCFNLCYLVRWLITIKISWMGLYKLLVRDYFFDIIYSIFIFCIKVTVDKAQSSLVSFIKTKLSSTLCEWEDKFTFVSIVG